MFGAVPGKQRNFRPHIDKRPGYLPSNSPETATKLLVAPERMHVGNAGGGK